MLSVTNMMIMPFAAFVFTVRLIVSVGGPVFKKNKTKHDNAGAALAAPRHIDAVTIIHSLLVLVYFIALQGAVAERGGVTYWA